MIVQPSHERVIAKLQFKCELQTCELDLAKHMKFCIWVNKEIVWIYYEIQYDVQNRKKIYHNVRTKI